MAGRRTLRLKTREQRELEHYRDHDARPYVRERCSALLRMAAGETPHAFKGTVFTQREAFRDFLSVSYRHGSVATAQARSGLGGGGGD
jgi:hypothetical protein